MTVLFYKQTEVPDTLLKFAVIVARLGGKWILCRHKQRSTWEIPGGHREADEAILETAKRELNEETGAIDFELKPVCVYGVSDGNEITYGLLCFADVKALEKLSPETEIGETGLFDTLPDELTYPAIQPKLFDGVQGWLNTQSNPNEIWDIYDESRKPTGRTHRRGDMLGKGEYHLVVHVWIENGNGEFLLTKRTPNKGFPNMWECTGGSALSGDDSKTAAMREVKEETGITLDEAHGKCIISQKRSDNFCDVWLFRKDFELSEVKFQENETCGAMFASKETILEMRRGGMLVPLFYLDEFFEKADLLQ